MNAKATIAGFLVGAVAGAFVALMVGWVVVGMESQKARRGWTLEPAVVAAQGVPAGTILELDMVQQQPIPEQFLTDSVVRPGQVNTAVGRTLRHALRRGDPVRWQDLDEVPDEVPGEAAVVAEE